MAVSLLYAVLWWEPYASDCREAVVFLKIIKMVSISFKGLSIVYKSYYHSVLISPIRDFLKPSQFLFKQD